MSLAAFLGVKVARIIFDIKYIFFKYDTLDINCKYNLDGTCVLINIAPFSFIYFYMDSTDNGVNGKTELKVTLVKHLLNYRNR